MNYHGCYWTIKRIGDQPVNCGRAVYKETDFCVSHRNTLHPRPKKDKVAPMTKQKRGTCVECKKSIRLNKIGSVYAHVEYNQNYPEACFGSGFFPTKVIEAATKKASKPTKIKRAAPLRGTCQDCKVQVGVNNDGSLYLHLANGWNCSGSYKPPLEHTLVYNVASLKKHPCLEAEPGFCKHESRYDGEFVECYSELQELIRALPEN